MLCSNLNWFVSISVATLECIKDYIIVSKTRWNVSVHFSYHLCLRETFRLALLPNVSSWIKISCCLGTWLVFINFYCNFFGRISRIHLFPYLHNFLFLENMIWPGGGGSLSRLIHYLSYLKTNKSKCSVFLINVVLFKFEVYCLLISYYRNLIPIFFTSSLVL